jgi:hypothetical protein
MRCNVPSASGLSKTVRHFLTRGMTASGDNDERATFPDVQGVVAAPKNMAYDLKKKL